jgi:RNA 2',3'-cyclic 3'-phosphodiesterase
MAPCYGERSAMTTTTRLFIALWPDATVRAALQTEQERWQWPAGAALTPPANLHLTLHFIGAVPTPQVAELAHGLVAPITPLVLQLDHTEVWPNRCAILGAHHAPPALLALHAALADALVRLQLPVDTRAFAPHVTLARKAAGGHPPARTQVLSWPIEGYALVQSAEGRYTPVAHYAVK